MSGDAVIFVSSPIDIFAGHLEARRYFADMVDTIVIFGLSVIL